MYIIVKSYACLLAFLGDVPPFYADMVLTCNRLILFIAAEHTLAIKASEITVKKGWFPIYFSSMQYENYVTELVGFSLQDFRMRCDLPLRCGFIVEYIYGRLG